MRLEEFLHRLHHDVDSIRPPDWVVDWDDAPLGYKLYRGRPAIPLAADVPLSLECEGRQRQPSAVPALREIGHFLWYAFGLTQVVVTPWLLRGRRFAPSGGGLYPSELYAYLKIDGLPAGVYHYDVAHHRLVLLREGDFDSYLNRALGDRCAVEGCFGAVLVSTMFWKNFFKYNNFGYRLQGLDAGAMIGQLLEVAKRFGYETGVYFQFLDRALNHLLGLQEQEESVYAVIPLSVDASVWSAGENVNQGAPVTADALCRELEPLHHEHVVRSKVIKEYPMVLWMNEASMLDSTASFRQVERPQRESVGQEFALPCVEKLAYDLAAASRKRHSPSTDFVWGEVSRERLATLLQEATASFAYRNDLDGMGEKGAPRVSLYGCLKGVEGIPEGAYHYDSAGHVLRQLRNGEFRFWLQQENKLQNVNLNQVPLCLHVVGDRDHLVTELGYRGHRIQQMEAGMLVQRLLLASCAVGMMGHPLLDFHTCCSDEIFELAPRGKTCLIQIPVGYDRPRFRLEGSLHG